MRRILLVGAAALAISAGNARAQMPVVDMKSIAQLLQEIQVLRQQYQELQNVYSTLAHGTDVLGLAPELGRAGLRNPFPTTGELSGILSGNGGSGSQLSGLINEIQQQNQAYKPDGADWSAQWINQSAASNAGVQALAQNMVTSLQARQAGLADLEQSIGTAPDVTQLSAIQDRLTTEENFVSTQQTEAQLLATLATAQTNAEQQQLIQEQRKDSDALFNDTKPLP